MHRAKANHTVLILFALPKTHQSYCGIQIQLSLE